MKKASKFKLFLRILALAVTTWLVLSLPVGCTKKLNTKEASKASVMIRNKLKTGGGSGVVIRSLPSNSLVLTNRHVCEAVKKEGIVTTDDGLDHAIADLKIYDKHDLCLITITEDLGASTDIAAVNPRRYEKATIIGHPSLYPTTITKGFFSARLIVNVHIKDRECTELEKLNPENIIACGFFGVMPVFESFDTIFVSATIMPGSSGSPIYNEHGEIAALVFAGLGDLGYTFAVPVEYIRNFLNEELNSSHE